MRQGDRSSQPFNASVAHAVVLSVWHRLQAFGIFIASLCAGVMNGLTAFEIEAFFRFTPGERQVIEERRRPELTK